jgi:GT2 family glycosyltransferase
LIAPFNDPKVGIVGPRMTDVVHGGNGNYTGATFVAPSLEWVWVNQQHSTPYTVPLIPGGCQAVRRTEFEQLGMFDPGMTRWGSEDYELCLHYWMRGFNLAIQPDTLIYHVFRTKSHYTVQAPQVLYNRLRLAALHFSDARFGRVLDAYAGSPDLSQIVLWLMDSDTMQQRKRYAEQRTRDDDAYCLTYRVTV